MFGTPLSEKGVKEQYRGADNHECPPASLLEIIMLFLFIPDLWDIQYDDGGAGLLTNRRSSCS